MISSFLRLNRENTAQELLFQEFEQFHVFQLCRFRALSCAFVRGLFPRTECKFLVALVDEFV